MNKHLSNGITKLRHIRRSQLTKNYLYNLAYQLLIIILPLITVPYISRVLGAENIGIYSYTISITTYFITFGSLGIALYGQREIAYQQQSKHQYSQTFWEIFVLRLLTTSLSLLIFFLVFVINNFNNYGFYFAILAIEIIASIFDISWFFQGHEAFKQIVLRNLLIKAISVIAIFTFVKTPHDLPAYFFIYVISTLLGNLSLWTYLPRYLQTTHHRHLNLKRHLKPTLTLFIPQIAIQVYTLLDKTMIGLIISDKSEVGFYDQSQKIIKLLLTVITSLGTVMLPRIANTFARGNHAQIRHYLQNSTKFVLLLSIPMIIGIWCLADLFVPMFFGPGYAPVATLMKITAPILLLIGLSNVTGNQFLLPTKQQKAFTISVILGAIINFSTNLLLIPHYGALGASYGTVIAEATVTAAQFYFIYRLRQSSHKLTGNHHEKH